MDFEDDKYLKLREYSRVDAYIPIEIRLVPEEDRLAVKARTSIETAFSDPQPLPEIEDGGPLVECLKIINAKLDNLIRMVAFQSREISALQPHQVNLSAGGLCINLPRPYEPEDLLEVRMMFPTMPYLVFTVYGLVIQGEEASDGTYLTSIEFTEIDEDIRDRIAKYVFERQREILRKKRRQ